MYQREKCFSRSTKKHFRKQQRYSLFFQKQQAQAKLNESRSKLVNVLTAIRNKKEEEYWNNTLKILKDMQAEFQTLEKVPAPSKPVDVIKYSIQIFDIASRYQDMLNGKLLCAPEEKAEALKRFNDSLSFCGRHESYDLRQDADYGPVPYWNTTKVGEPITLDNIYFGADLGFSSKPASYWIKLPKKKRMYITEETTYKYGKIAKELVVWQTEGIVKLGVYTFCKLAKERLIEDLETLLASELY